MACWSFFREVKEAPFIMVGYNFARHLPVQSLVFGVIMAMTLVPFSKVGNILFKHNRLSR